MQVLFHHHCLQRLHVVVVCRSRPFLYNHMICYHSLSSIAGKGMTLGSMPSDWCGLHVICFTPRGLAVTNSFALCARVCHQGVLLRIEDICILVMAPLLILLHHLLPRRRLWKL